MATRKKDFNYYSGKRYDGMMGRCYRETDNSYKNYGARDIRVCTAWVSDINSFRSWLSEQLTAMNVQPEDFCEVLKSLELDRIDPDSHYSPGNCRLVTKQVNARNKRGSKNKVVLSAEGDEFTFRGDRMMKNAVAILLMFLTISCSKKVEVVFGVDGKSGKDGIGSVGPQGPQGLPGEDAVSCSVTEVEDGALITCPNSEPVLIRDGVDGDLGADGENGLNALPCTAQEVEGGVSVSCPGSDPVFLASGQNGSDGDVGPQGPAGQDGNASLSSIQFTNASGCVSLGSGGLYAKKSGSNNLKLYANSACSNPSVADLGAGGLELYWLDSDSLAVINSTTLTLNIISL